MHKKFEINRTKVKGGCQSGRKVTTHDSKSDLPLINKLFYELFLDCLLTFKNFLCIFILLSTYICIEQNLSKKSGKNPYK